MAPRFKVSQRWVGWLAATAFLLSVTSPAMAGQTGTGTVTGKVIDSSGGGSSWRNGDGDEPGAPGAASDTVTNTDGE